MSKGNNALAEPTAHGQDMRREIINMKQSIELAIARIINARMEELANMIHEYEERIDALGDNVSEWETIHTLYATKQGLIMAFNTIFDIPYCDYDRDYLE